MINTRALIMLVGCGIAASGFGYDIGGTLLRSEFVGIGKVVRSELPSRTLLDDTGAAIGKPFQVAVTTFTVESVYKGDVSKEIRVVTATGYHARDDYPKPVGFRYLIMAVKAKELVPGSAWGIPYDKYYLHGNDNLETEKWEYVAAADASELGLQMLFTPGEGALIVPLTSDCPLPDPKASLLQKVTQLIASAAMKLADWGSEQQYWDMLADMGSEKTRVKDHSLDTIGAGKQLDSWLSGSLIPAIKTWLADRTDREKVWALAAVVCLGDQSSIAAFTDAITHLISQGVPEEELPMYRLSTLADSKTNIPQLIALTSADSATIRAGALASFRAIAYTSKSEVRDAGARAIAKKLLSDKDQDVVLAAIWLLVTLDDDWSHAPSKYHVPGWVPKESLDYWLGKE